MQLDSLCGFDTSALHPVTWRHFDHSTFNNLKTPHVVSPQVAAAAMWKGHVKHTMTGVSSKGETWL